MSVDKSLKLKNSLERARSVLTRSERIAQLRDQEKFDEDQSIFGLPKVRVYRAKRRTKGKKEEKEEG